MDLDELFQTYRATPDDPTREKRESKVKYKYSPDDWDPKFGLNIGMHTDIQTLRNLLLKREQLEREQVEREQLKREHIPRSEKDVCGQKLCQLLEIQIGTQLTAHDWRLWVLANHPDKGGDLQQFQLASSYWDMFKDPTKEYELPIRMS